MCWYTVFCPPSLQACMHFFSFLFISEHKEHQLSPSPRVSFSFAFPTLPSSPCSVLLFCSSLSGFSIAVFLSHCCVEVFSNPVLLLASVLFSCVLLVAVLYALSLLFCFVLHCSFFPFCKCFCLVFCLFEVS